MVVVMKRMSSMALALVLALAFVPMGVGQGGVMRAAADEPALFSQDSVTKDAIQLGTKFRADVIDKLYASFVEAIKNPTGSAMTRVDDQSLSVYADATLKATRGEMAKAALRAYESPQAHSVTQWPDVYAEYLPADETNTNGDEPQEFMTFGYDIDPTGSPLGAYRERSQRFEAKVLEALAWTGGRNSDAEKAKALYDYLATTCTSLDRPNSSNGEAAYACLVNGRSSSIGIAKSYNYLLSRAGIESRLVTGEVNGSSQTWVMAKVGGAWYHCDAARAAREGVTELDGSLTPDSSFFLMSDATVKTKGYTWKTDRCIGGTTATPATAASDYANSTLRNQTLRGPATHFGVTAPCTPVAELVDPGTISLEWGASYGAEGYEVYRSASPSGGFQKIYDTTSTNYLENGLDRDKTYYYQIEAYRTTSSGKEYTHRSATVAAHASYDLSLVTAQIPSISGLPKLEYSLEALTPQPVVTYGSRTLYEGVQYAISYKNNVNAGTATITITGIGDCVGSRTLDFIITPYDIGTVNAVNPKDMECTGKPLEQDIVLTVPDFDLPQGAKPGVGTLVKGVDYTVEYTNNIRPGDAYMKVSGIGNYVGDRIFSFKITGEMPPEPDDPGSGDEPSKPGDPGNPGDDNGADGVTRIVMYRLYNPNSGEHFYTDNAGEREATLAAGWNDEGIGWTAPVEGGSVYRLYNANAGEHHYTMSEFERDNLIAAGWIDEGVGWYSDPNQKVPLYRAYNPNAFANNHHYTVDLSEFQTLISLGWRGEGIGWHGIE